MVRLPSPVATLRRLFLPAALTLLGALGCVDHTAGGTTLYVYDNTSSTVQVWADVNAVYNAQQAGTAIPAASRTISSSVITGDIAWGGVAVNSNTNTLYLVSEAGAVFAIAKANTQNGALSLTSDITTFNLGSPSNTGDRFSVGSVFGQAAVDSTSNILYVMENATDGSATRVWRITNASQAAQLNGNGFTFTPATTYTTGVSGDTFGAGVAAGTGGVLFGLFGGGSSIYYDQSTNYGGPRIRYGSGGVFPTPILNIGSNVLVGGTGLSNSLSYGALGFDVQNNALYVFAQGSTEIKVFNKSEFLSGVFTQGPVRSLGDNLSALANPLRIISHPTSSDWMLGASLVTPDATSTIGEGTGGPTLLIWKTPSAGGAALSVSMPPTATGPLEIRGMDIGGTN